MCKIGKVTATALCYFECVNRVCIFKNCVVDRVMLLQRCPYPKPSNLQIYYLRWHRELVKESKNLEVWILFWTIQVGPISSQESS